MVSVSDIVSTLAYATAQKRLLSLEEIYRYQLYTEYSLQELESALQHAPYIRFQYGLYGFEDTFDTLYSLRREKERESLRRYRTVRRVAPILENIPFIKAIFLAGSTTFATGNAKKDSDIDIFIITNHSRIWLARMIITIITHTLGVRRVGIHEENRLCLNHYITEHNYYRSDHTVYSAQLYSDYMAIGERSQAILTLFWQANSWRTSFFPQASPRKHYFFLHNRKITSMVWLENILEKTGIAGYLNHIARQIQNIKIRYNPLNEEKGAQIIISEHELEFHPHPNSPKVEQAMQTIIKKYSV